MKKLPQFKPIRLPDPLDSQDSSSLSKLTVTSTLKGDVVDEFEQMREEYNLNRSQLLRQMIFHCLGKSEELKNIYKRMLILGD